jgi:hypothetical protein
MFLLFVLYKRIENKEIRKVDNPAQTLPLIPMKGCQ